MKSILILGAVTLDVAAYVKDLPKGNEDFQPLRQESRLSGNGYEVKKILDGFGLENELIAPIGTGIYAQQTQEMAEKEGIELTHTIDEIQGSTYHIIASDKKQSVFVVPGAEYTYDTSFLEYAGEDDYRAVVLTADYLSSENGDELIDQLSWLQCPIYFVPGGRLENVEEEMIEQALEISSVLYLTNEEVKTLSGVADSLEKGIEVLQKEGEKTVIVYSNTDGLLYMDAEEKLQAPAETISSLDERRLQNFASYLAAVLSGVDVRNALVFAMEFTKLIDRSDGVLDDYDWNEMKQRLVRMITWKS